LQDVTNLPKPPALPTPNPSTSVSPARASKPKIIGTEANLIDTSGNDDKKADDNMIDNMDEQVCVKYSS